MTFDPRKLDSSWTMIQPGCYMDPAGATHLFPDEIVAYLQIMHPECGFRHSKADYDLIVGLFIRELSKKPGMTVKFIRHERQAS
jgi:hypothetical protein